jgi:hypothetical protein
LSLFVLKFSISSGLKEKYATSDADIRAEPARRIASITIPVIVCKSGALTEMADRTDIKERELTGSKLKVF